MGEITITSSTQHKARKRNSQTQTYNNNNNNNNNNENLSYSTTCPWPVLVSRHTYHSRRERQFSERRGCRYGSSFRKPSLVRSDSCLGERDGGRRKLQDGSANFIRDLGADTA